MTDEEIVQAVYAEMRAEGKPYATYLHHRVHTLPNTDGLEISNDIFLNYENRICAIELQLAALQERPI